MLGIRPNNPREGWTGFAYLGKTATSKAEKLKDLPHRKGRRNSITLDAMLAPSGARPHSAALAEIYHLIVVQGTYSLLPDIASILPEYLSRSPSIAGMAALDGSTRESNADN